MQILLLILKIIGLVILGLLALVIFLLLLILFWPIRYRALVSYHSEPFADVRVGWLGMAAFKLKLEKGELWYRLRFLGITLKEKGGSAKAKKADKRIKGKRNKRKAGDRGRTKRREETEYGDIENTENTEKTEKTEKTGETERTAVIEQKNSGHAESKVKDKKSIASKIAGIFGKIKNILNSIKEKIRDIWNKFLSLCHKIKKVYEFITLKENRDNACALLKIGTRLLKHMRPRKIKGFLRFGTDDPCRTGQILGVLAVFYGFYGKNISIYPEFEKSCFDGEILIRGYMQVGVILFHALKIYLSKELKTLKYNYQQLKEEL